MSVLLVAAGAAVGAVARHLVDRSGRRRHGAYLPWGTLVVNVTGSLLLGLLSAADGRVISLLLGVGFCGAFTTYSTFGSDTVRLGRDGFRRRAALNVVANLTLGLAAALLGGWLSHLHAG